MARRFSQVIKFDFRFGFIGEPRPLAQGPLEGRRIDSVEVGGYREELRSEIDECLKVLSGRLYDKEQVERVWRKLIELGHRRRSVQAPHRGGVRRSAVWDLSSS
jgi:hypothetical protein